MRDRRLLAALIVLAVCKGILFAAVTPAFQAPDEPTHSGYIEYLAIEHRVPDTSEGLLPTANRAVLDSHWWDEQTMADLFRGPHIMQISAGAHPPLYYTLMAPLFWVSYRFGDIWILLIRGFGALMGAWLVWLAYRTARLMFPDSKWIPLTAGTIIALHPQLGFIMSSINNDVLVIPLASLFLYLGVKLIGKPDLKTTAFMGAVLGAGLLAKSSFILYLALGGLLIAGLAVVRRIGRREIGWYTLALYGPAVLLSGWWYLGNIFKYGSIMPAIAPVTNGAKVGLLSTAFSPAFAEKIFAGFWGYFGWLTVPLNYKIYFLLLVATCVAAAGVALWMFRPSKKLISPKSGNLMPALFILAALAANYAAVVQFEVASRGGAQGRYLFLSIIPVAVLLAIGLGQFTPERAARAMFATVLAALLWLAAASAILYMVPYYYA